MSQESPSNESIKLWQIFCFLLPLVIIIIIKAPLTASLWLDETITDWVIKDSFSDVISRSYNYQGQSPFYFAIVWLLQSIIEHKELALRLPSLFFGVCAAFLLYKLTCKLFDKETALITLLSFICLDEIIKACISARPYSLALAGSIGSLLALTYWIKSGSKISACLFVASNLVAFYAHFLFVGIILPQLALFKISSEHSTKSTWKNFIILLIITFIFFIPGIPQLLYLYGRKQTLVFATSPSLTQLFYTIIPLYMLIYLITAIVVAAISKKFKLDWKKITNERMFALLLVWLIIPPLAYFLHATLSGDSLFLKRLFLWHLPALVVLSARILKGVSPKKLRLIAIATFSFFVFMREASRRWHIEDWRGATQIANQLHEKANLPVLAFPGLIESKQITWLKDKKHEDYLLAPFTSYPLPREAIILPSHFESNAREDYYTKFVAPEVSKSGGFILIANQFKNFNPGTKQRYVHQYLIDYFKTKNHTVAEEYQKGLVRVYRFTQKN